MKHIKRHKLPENIVSLVIVLESMIVVFAISRLMAYLVLVKEVLPVWLFLNLAGYRIHHFVYGNIIIVITSFMAIALGMQGHKKLLALFYGIGLGLVLDEFLMWMGDVKVLTTNMLWIPRSLSAISVVALIIASFILFRLHQDKL